MNKHHVIPTSRRGTETVDWDEDFHRCFHQCFRNMTPIEITEFLEHVNMPGGFWDAKRLHDLREIIISGRGGKYLPKKKKP